MCHAKDFDLILHMASIKIGLECNIILHPQKWNEHYIRYVIIALYKLAASTSRQKQLHLIAAPFQYLLWFAMSFDNILHSS